ncbi:hypothetical protein BGZ95_011500 [Linnemannia exigua]|uniref:HCP-like protein n=1 Tax=Linnemannia exigua TaxID=604196 RepID=A0AAD4D9S1_9FUNG|nr:hypothetical protein BGZ95_011500 [Linnemannia exigua]
MSLPMAPSDDEDQDDVQVIRLASSNRTIHIATHMDPTFGKSIVLWGDVLRVFPEGLYLQRGKKVIPFMKGGDFEDLKPLRIAAIPGAVLDVVVRGEAVHDAGPQQEETQLALTPLETPPSPPHRSTIGATGSAVSKSQRYGEVERSMENFNDMDPPSAFTESSAYKESPVDSSERRNPSYGLVEAAMENYTHMDRPNFSARGPQLVSDTQHDQQQGESRDNSRQLSSMTLSGRAPQDYLNKTPISTALLQEATAETPRLIAQADYVKGLQYEKGTGGVQQDYVKAMGWYVKAAEQGHAKAVANIVALFAYGRGVPKNDPAAVKWYIKAIEQGHVPAYRALASRYETGYGVSQDYSKAAELFLKAAELGDVGVYWKIAEIYEAGRGVSKDLVKAFEWQVKAFDRVCV